MKDAMNEADPRRAVTFTYTNHAGKKATRYVIPISIEFCSTKWHPVEQWILHAHDTVKGEDRSFAMNDIRDWQPDEV